MRLKTAVNKGFLDIGVAGKALFLCPRFRFYDRFCCFGFRRQEENAHSKRHRQIVWEGSSKGVTTQVFYFSFLVFSPMFNSIYIILLMQRRIKDVSDFANPRARGCRFYRGLRAFFIEFIYGRTLSTVGTH